MSQQPHNVILFQNSMVMVFDAHGEQIPALQGLYSDAVLKLKAADLSRCQFKVGVWLKGSFKVSQAEFFDPALLDEWSAFGEAMRSLQPALTNHETSSQFDKLLGDLEQNSQ